ncbi:MAG: aldehyde dehydrogenase family protein [Phycisphaera sp.]|nr:MAG: aldehyde dehydrogenase family protein [Phycisphaera sp.]
MPQTTAANPLESLPLSGDPRFIPGQQADPGDTSQAVSYNPTTGQPLAGVRLEGATQLEAAIVRARAAFLKWRLVPAPERGEVVRRIGHALREHKDVLGALVSMEVGKIASEGLGEVQETIDIADYAVGLSRMLGGRTMPSERADHRLFEQWQPIGPIGVITAFNFPNAVWGWNAMVAAVCGDTVVWKPSLMAPLTAMATNAIADKVATEMGHEGLFNLVIGNDETVGKPMVADARLPLISATGSTAMGRAVGQVVAGRLGKCLLELGGNNAVIVEPDADLDLAVPALLFAAVGTAGQRCTSTRRLIAHESIVEPLLEKLVDAYERAPIGDPLDDKTLVGPLIHDQAGEAFDAAIVEAKAQGGTVLVGGERADVSLGGCYVRPTIIRAPSNNTLPIAQEETFAPIMYAFGYRDLDEAIAINNGVAHGLSSAIMTAGVRASERFLSPAGSDCGIANVNIGTSGAEIGGAFGGEKDTGGGREAGSDSWKAYMRRQTCTINYGASLRLAQGVQFG